MTEINEEQFRKYLKEIQEKLLVYIDSIEDHIDADVVLMNYKTYMKLKEFVNNIC